MTFSRALVTGASSGIGEALAHLLADQGIPLIIVGRNTERLEAVATELRKKVGVTAVALDLAKDDERAKLVRLIQEEVPDLVVNNAGLGLYGAVLSYTTSKQREVFDVNATAVFELTIEAARSLVTAGKKGTIMNIASSAAYQPFPYFTTYTSTKAFVKSFGEGLDYELAPQGVRVLTSCPGVITTRFQERAVDNMDFKKHSLHTIPLDFAVNDIWKQIQSGQTVRIFDWKFHLFTFLSAYLIPRKVLYWILNRFFIGQLPHRNLVPAPKFPTKSNL